ncbi:MAG: putative rane protein [Candidatus Saccharibacteria bacterium]|nr:putative rane protein [Candidatus Saccharibacteria bacterium]
MSHLFYRNVHARDNLELFLVSAVSSLLLLRFLLYLTGYPQVGGGSLHIAHMLYGGLLMLAAIVLVITFLGARVQRLAALLGGLGFGIFIDELGKFITKDNNYFFRPTVGIIYALFIVLYLIFNSLSRVNRLTPREYELNALNQFEEAVLKDLDSAEKRQIRRLLKASDQKSPVTQELQKLLDRIDTVPTGAPNRMQRLLSALDRGYVRFWNNRASRRAIGALFIAQAVIFLVSVIFTVFQNFSNISELLHSTDSYAKTLIIGQLASSAFAAGFTIAGALRLLSSRMEAFNLFRRAVLINILLTEFFIFSRIQFGAVPGFVFSLVLLAGLHYALLEERRSPHRA